MDPQLASEYERQLQVCIQLAWNYFVSGLTKYPIMFGQTSYY